MKVSLSPGICRTACATSPAAARGFAQTISKIGALRSAIWFLSIPYESKLSTVMPINQIDLADARSIFEIVWR